MERWAPWIGAILVQVLSLSTVLETEGGTVKMESPQKLDDSYLLELL